MANLMRKGWRRPPPRGGGAKKIWTARHNPEFVPLYGGESDLFHLRVVELDRGRTAENRHRDLQTCPLLVHILDRAVERGKGAVGHLDLLADLEADGGLAPLHPLLG